MLPKYYVIQRDRCNPLWNKYIDWLNKQVWKEYFTWNDFLYYWYDGHAVRNWYNCEYRLDDFYNKPEIITLEEWYNNTDTEEININETHNNINNVPMENKWYICIVAWWQAPTMVHKNIEEASIEAMRLCSKENRKVSIATIVKVYKPKIIAEEQI